MMRTDHEVTREVWESKIPVEFVLGEDVALVQQPKPYYVLVPRISYFPLIMEKVGKYFLSFVDAAEVEELWLEFDDAPLKWHLPIGVLYDTLKRDEALPWTISIRLKKFPAEAIVALGGKEAVESVFMQSLKEADQLKHRSAVVNAMTKRDHKQLWNSLLNDRYDQFWAVNARLMDGNGEEPFFHIPLRIYEDDGGFIQRLWRWDASSGERQTVGDVVGQAGTWVSHGIRVPLNTPLLWLAHNLAYPDNFVYLVPAHNTPRHS